MKREIRFRGIRIDNDEWAYGDLIQSNSGDDPIIMEVSDKHWDVMKHGHAVKEETVGQYTGRKDRHGKRIYDGHTIKSSFEEGGITYESFLPVFYSEEDACFMIDLSIDKSIAHLSLLSE